MRTDALTVINALLIPVFVATKSLVCYLIATNLRSINLVGSTRKRTPCSVVTPAYSIHSNTHGRLFTVFDIVSRCYSNRVSNIGVTPGLRMLRTHKCSNEIC